MSARRKSLKDECVMDGLNWSCWYPIACFTTSNDPNLEKRGVYRIRVRGKGIPRAAGVDCQGIIYIGKAPKKALKDRITEFRKSAQDGAQTHVAGIRYHDKPCYQGCFPLDHLEVSWVAAGGPAALEHALLCEYECLFCDLPPLNHQG